MNKNKSEPNCVLISYCNNWWRSEVDGQWQKCTILVSYGIWRYREMIVAAGRFRTFQQLSVVTWYMTRARSPDKVRVRTRFYWAKKGKKGSITVEFLESWQLSVFTFFWPKGGDITWKCERPFMHPSIHTFILPTASRTVVKVKLKDVFSNVDRRWSDFKFISTTMGLPVAPWLCIDCRFILEKNNQRMFSCAAPPSWSVKWFGRCYNVKSTFIEYKDLLDSR